MWVQSLEKQMELFTSKGGNCLVFSKNAHDRRVSFFSPRYLLHYESKIRCCRQKAISPTQRANASGQPKGKAVDLQHEARLETFVQVP